MGLTGTLMECTMSDLRINPDRLRTIVVDALKALPADDAETLRRKLTWDGANILPVLGEPGRYVILAGGDIPVAIVNAADIEDEHGVTGGLSTPDGYRK